MTDLRLPSANEFSPGQIDLRKLLEVLRPGFVDRKSAVVAIAETFFPRASKSIGNKRSGNVLIGAYGYGVWDKDRYRLTSLGEGLADLDTDQEMWANLARHILLDLNGMELVASVRAMQLRGDPVNKESLARELSTRGFRSATGGQIPLNTTDHFQMINWLRKAGVFAAKGYSVNNAVLSNLTGHDIEDVLGVIDLSEEQNLFLRGLLALGGEGETVQVSHIVRWATQACGARLGRPDQYRAHLIVPLVDDGWITLRASESAGRGGKSGWVKATDKTLNMSPAFFKRFQSTTVSRLLGSLYDTPLPELWNLLSSSSTHEKGLALEKIAARAVCDLGLMVIDLRRRGADTKGAEVDIIAHGAHLLYSRWLVQCKNEGSRTGLDALAKEVGLAVILKANVVMLVSVSGFTKDVYSYARSLMQDSTLQVILVDGTTLKDYRDRGSVAILSFVLSEAKRTLELKSETEEA